MGKGNPFYRNHDVDAIRKISNDETLIKDGEGFVVVVNQGGTATVQFAGSSSTIETEIVKGVYPKNGDHVFMKRSNYVNRWFIYAIGIIQSLSGNPSGTQATSSILAAPNSQITIPGKSMIIFQWTPPGVRPDVVYQVEVADDNIGTGAVQTLVPGGNFVVAVGSAVTKYFRVRSVDKDWNTSGWTVYTSGTSLA